MKAEVKQKEEAFKPIDLVITIENEQDLCTLWHLFNQTEAETNKMIDDVLKYKSDKPSDDVWKKLDFLVNKYNLRK